MKPYHHARNSVKKWGDKVEDHLPIHDFIDSTKAAMPDMRHRAILHNAFGCFIVEKVFGTYIVNSDEIKVQTRDIAESHIIEDVGFLPTIQDYLRHLPMVNWFGGPKERAVRKIPLTTEPKGIDDPEDMIVDGAADYRKKLDFGTKNVQAFLDKLQKD